MPRLQAVAVISMNNWSPGRTGFRNLALSMEAKVADLFPDFVVGGQIGEYPPHLGHPFDDEHPRHDGVAREMSGEERLVDSNILQTDDPFSRFVLHHPVHEQERISGAAVSA